MNQNILSVTEMRDYYNVGYNLDGILRRYYGLPDTASTRAMLEAEIEAAKRQHEIMPYQYKSKVMYVTKENIDGEELFILSEEVSTLSGNPLIGRQEEFSTLYDLVQWVSGNTAYNHLSIVLRYDVEDAPEEIQSWSVSEDEMYYELLIYPN